MRWKPSTRRSSDDRLQLARSARRASRAGSTAGAPAAACRSAAGRRSARRGGGTPSASPSRGTSNVRPLNVTSSDASSKTSASASSIARSPAGPAQEELAHAKPAVLEPAAAGEKRERAGAAAEARRLDVEEDDAIGPAGMRGQRADRTARAATPRRARTSEAAGGRATRQRHTRGRSTTHEPMAASATTPAEIGGRFDRRRVAPPSSGTYVSSRTRRGLRRRARARGILLDDARGAGRRDRAWSITPRGAWPPASASSSRDATDLASGPVAPSGPTHDGQPDSHGQPSISSRVRASRSLVHREQRLAEPDAAGIVVVEEDRRLGRERLGACRRATVRPAATRPRGSGRRPTARDRGGRTSAAAARRCASRTRGR